MAAKVEVAGGGVLTMRAALAFALCATLATAGCTWNPPVTRSPEFEVQVTPMDGSDPLRLDVTFVVHDTFRYHDTDACHQYDVVVYEGVRRITALYDYGDPANPWPGYCFQVETDMVLRPGRTTSTFHWNGNDDGNGTSPRDVHHGPRVPAGTYTVVIQSQDIESVRTEVDIAVPPHQPM